MNIDVVRDHCLSKKAVTESFPFDENTLVFKVMGKMFVMAPLNKWDQGEGSGRGINHLKMRSRVYHRVKR